MTHDFESASAAARTAFATDSGAALPLVTDVRMQVEEAMLTGARIGGLHLGLHQQLRLLERAAQLQLSVAQVAKPEEVLVFVFGVDGRSVVYPVRGEHKRLFPLTRTVSGCGHGGPPEQVACAVLAYELGLHPQAARLRRVDSETRLNISLNSAEFWAVTDRESALLRVLGEEVSLTYPGNDGPRARYSPFKRSLSIYAVQPGEPARRANEIARRVSRRTGIPPIHLVSIVRRPAALYTYRLDAREERHIRSRIRERRAARLMARERLAVGVAQADLDAVVSTAIADTWHIGSWREFRETYRIAPQAFAVDLIAPVLGDPNFTTGIETCVREPVDP